MSAINQMLRDLDKRNALAKGAAPLGAQAAAGAAPNTLASAYASVRLMGPRTRLSRNVLMVAGAAALLPIAWATTYLDLPISAASIKPVVPLSATVQVATAPMVAPTVPSIAEPLAEPATVSTPAPAQPVVVAIASVVAAPALPPPMVDAPPAPTPSATTVAAPPVPPTPSAPRTRTVRAPVVVALNGEDDNPPPVARQAARPSATRDTRLALASPTVPKDETRIERRPTDARDDLVRAGEAMSIGRVSDAIVLLRKVIQAEPDNERARLALLSLLAERGRDDTWRSMLAESARVLPKRFGLAAAQGMAESGHFEESLAILKGLPESVRDMRYFSALGAMHQQLNQHAEAVAAFDAALGKAAGGSPQLPSLLVAQALSMQSLGRAAEARRNLERVRLMPEAAADVRDFAVRELAHSR